MKVRYGYIYVLQTPEYFKIGFSAHLKSRMDSHRTYLKNRGEVIQLGCFPASTLEDTALRARMAPSVNFGSPHGGWPSKDWFVRDERRTLMVAELPLVPIDEVIRSEEKRVSITMPLEWWNDLQYLASLRTIQDADGNKSFNSVVLETLDRGMVTARAELAEREARDRIQAGEDGW